MSNKITSIRGMNDVLPEQTPLWQWLAGCAAIEEGSFAVAPAETLRLASVEEGSCVRSSAPPLGIWWAG